MQFRGEFSANLRKTTEITLFIEIKINRLTRLHIKMKSLILFPIKKVKPGKNLQKIFPVPNTVFLAMLRHTVLYLVYSSSLTGMVRNKYNFAAFNSHLLKAFPLALKRGDEPFCRIPL
jgi:hypothetical protein